MSVKKARLLFAAIAALAIAACAGGGSRAVATPSAQPYDPKALPTGPVGTSIAYGHDIIVKTPALMKRFVRADLTCEDCHLAAGTQARGGTFIGTYGRFPQWNKRAHRVIALQDRIAECFLYSMNGRPPGYASKEMIAVVAYIAWLSRDTPVGQPQPESDRYIEPLPTSSPNNVAGSALYAQKCALCHGTDGQGISGVYPPLWGARSFNNLAGMAHLDRMTGFVRYNMPQNAPGSLSIEQAYDVSAFILSHKHPRFRWNVLVAQPALRSRYF